ncbi:MAG: hypothetical protein FWE20_10470 [Defluviitaleaceae bacterium]|nr:hypothetical protein [Defluviitaleaceae bacterium]
MIQGFIGVVREIKDSFSDSFPSSFRDIVGIPGKMANIANAAAQVSPSLSHATNRLISTTQKVAVVAMPVDHELAGMPESAQSSATQ